MKKTFLRKNQEVFQGEKKIKNSPYYFEGWYYKNVKENFCISCIPGISITKEKKVAFIQILMPSGSYYIEYPISSFRYSYSPFLVRIGDCVFGDKYILLNIEQKGLSIHGKLFYIYKTPIKSSFLSPNIMGPFSYLSFMQCNHAIISMNHLIYGNLTINGKIINFNEGNGYIEKDWGTSFPKTYTWLQANNFQNPTSSLFFSVADIPMKLFHFQGFICVFKIDSREFRFCTYQSGKLLHYQLQNNVLSFVLKQGDYTLKVYCQLKSNKPLAAPVKGQMNSTIWESVDSVCHIELYQKKTVILSDNSPNCGIEVVD